MEERPSAPLLRLLREATDARNLNTAALAKTAGVDRSELKQVLAGQMPLTVDMFIVLAQALELGATDFTELAAKTVTTQERPSLTPVAHREQAELPPADPLGNHASQTLRLGFALGCDIVFMLRTSALEESGIPSHIQEKFAEHLPIRLDAAFHGHNDPRFLPDCLHIKLSFDAIYECTLPWHSFIQITLIPLSSTSPAPEPDKPSGAHLRLVE